jgi:MOSC domain-containing protein YiiM
MRRTDTLQVTPAGISGDRYHEGTGSWSAHRTSPLTLIEAGLVAEVGRRLGVSLDPVSLRRNVVVEGGALEAWLGRRFRIGEVVLEGERPCDPCRYLERHLSIEGLKEALEGCGGLRVRVVHGGILQVGDRLTSD